MIHRIRRHRPGGRHALAAAAAVLALAGGGAIVKAAADQEPPPPAPQASSGLRAEPSAEDGGAPEPSGPALAASPPVRITIPAIDVAAPTTGLALKADRSLEVPHGATKVGWYTGAPTPGELGPAVLAGHVTWDGDPAVFFHLGDLHPGDTVKVDRRDGVTAVFRVTGVKQTAKNAFPTKDVYGYIGHAGLRLITCGGTYVQQQRRHLDNVIVFAELASSY
ncbi:class F sortase [Actinomadura darangshiensis]|uniref:Class F sortase n=1 Tax=Actinomadura darangshiensis TaxID=705336 RepID=A0A4R5ADG6_9ACTN|nr:class F sortase [Actinomadura darangshiensis]TDD67902.1 class F sortase [Actinomadura darangshiensis]